MQRAMDALKDVFSFQLGSGDTQFWYHDWLKTRPFCTLVPYVHISYYDFHLCDVCNLQHICTTPPDAITSRTPSRLLPLSTQMLQMFGYGKLQARGITRPLVATFGCLSSIRFGIPLQVGTGYGRFEPRQRYITSFGFASTSPFPTTSYASIFIWRSTLVACSAEQHWNRCFISSRTVDLVSPRRAFSA